MRVLAEDKVAGLASREILAETLAFIAVINKVAIAAGVVTPEVAEHKRRHIRETFRTHGKRLDAQVTAQISSLLVDLSQEIDAAQPQIEGKRKRRWNTVASASVEEPTGRQRRDIDPACSADTILLTTDGRTGSGG